jgi:hypothetical protein
LWPRLAKVLESPNLPPLSLRCSVPFSPYLDLNDICFTKLVGDASLLAPFLDLNDIRFLFTPPLRRSVPFQTNEVD